MKKESKFDAKKELIQSERPVLESDIAATKQCVVKLGTLADNSLMNPSLPLKGGGNYVNC